PAPRRTHELGRRGDRKRDLRGIGAAHGGPHCHLDHPPPKRPPALRCQHPNRARADQPHGRRHLTGIREGSRPMTTAGAGAIPTTTPAPPGAPRGAGEGWIRTAEDPSTVQHHPAVRAWATLRPDATVAAVDAL